jgi:hypothetical protein
MDVPIANLKVDFVDPVGKTLFSNTATFSLPSGQEKTFIYDIPTDVSVFGDYRLKYILTYGEKVASGEKIINRSYVIQNTFDKTTYSTGETINAAVNIANIGKFQEDLSVKVEVPEFQYSSNSSISISPQQTVTESYSIPVPLNAMTGKHSLLVVLGTGSVTKIFDFYIPESMLELSTLSGSCNAGESISVNVNNTGGGGTNYELSTTLRDMNGFAISNQNFTDSISAKDTKVHHLAVPSGSVSGQYI